MALRFIRQGGSKMKKCSKPLMGLLNSWNPSSNSCSLHSIGSSIPNLASDFTNNPHRNAFFGGTCIYQGAKQDEWIISLAKFSVTRHNQNQNAHLQFVRVVGASHTGLSSLLYHITLEASEAEKKKIFHAVVWLQLWRNLMEVLVWNCVHDYFSAIGIKSGDLKLHEAVMLSVNQKTEVLPQI